MRSVSRFLRVGVLASCIFLVIGVVEHLASPRAGEAILVPLPMGRILVGVARADAAATIHLGLLVLVCTPLARVIMLGVLFARRRETAFYLLSIGVLFLLLLSFFLSLYQEAG